MTEQPTYYAIVPANVRYDKTLKANEKLMYGEITCLSNKTGKCTAMNKYFADLYGVSKETISRWVSNLADRGYIRTQVVRDNVTNQVCARYISIAHEVLTEKSIPSPQNNQYPIDENVKENSTSNNNTSINTNSSEEESLHFSLDSIEEIKPSSADLTIDMFDVFWKEYPRKIGKGNALKAWMKIKNKKNVLEKTLSALEWQKKDEQWTKDGGQFVPHPSTYLNGMRWDDEKPPEVKKSEADLLREYRQSPGDFGRKYGMKERIRIEDSISGE